LGSTALLYVLATGLAHAGHVTDGAFTDASEWDSTRPTVSKVIFPIVGTHGGATLVAEQSGGILYVMDDYTNSRAIAPSQDGVFVDVFVRVPNATGGGGEDYDFRFYRPDLSSFFQAYQKPSSGPPSSVDENGTFILRPPIWTPMSPSDLIRSGF